MLKGVVWHKQGAELRTGRHELRIYACKWIEHKSWIKPIETGRRAFHLYYHTFKQLERGGDKSIRMKFIITKWFNVCYTDSAVKK